MEIGLTGLNEVTIPGARTKDNERGYDDDAIRAALGRPTPDRLLLIAQAIRLGVPLEDIQRSTAFDPWYLEQIAAIVATENQIGRAHVRTPVTNAHLVFRLLLE